MSTLTDQRLTARAVTWVSVIALALAAGGAVAYARPMVVAGLLSLAVGVVAFIVVGPLLTGVAVVALGFGIGAAVTDSSVTPDALTSRSGFRAFSAQGPPVCASRRGRSDPGNYNRGRREAGASARGDDTNLRLFRTLSVRLALELGLWCRPTACGVSLGTGRIAGGGRIRLFARCVPLTMAVLDRGRLSRGRVGLPRSAVSARRHCRAAVLLRRH